jgi:IclR family pca regulon transcriptional regulator
MDRHRFPHEEPAIAASSLSHTPAEAELSLNSSSSTGAPHKRDLIAGLEKGLMVIEAFDQQRPRLTITQVAARTGLTRAAARRYLITLAHLGYVTHDRKMFSLTPRVLRLGQSYMHSAQLPRIVQPELQKLAVTLHESATAGVLEESHVVCIASHNVGRTTAFAVHPGMRVPAYCAASGRVLISALPDEVLDAWIERQTFEPMTPHTVTSEEQLRHEIARVRVQGYSTIDQELEAGLRSLAVPLKNYRGQVVASLTVGGQASRTPLGQWVTDCLPTLLQTQAELRSLL